MNDDRYGKVKRYVDNLSKWVRGGVVHYNNALNMLAKLATFTQVIYTSTYCHIICFRCCFLLAFSLASCLPQCWGSSMFLGLPDRDPLVIIAMDPDPSFSHKGVERTEIILAKQNFSTKF
jgi:hypothetical protein